MTDNNDKFTNQENILNDEHGVIKLGLNPSDYILSKAISLTTKSLYSNKIKAIVRELTCNAYDSHVCAGYPFLPFIVKLPSYNFKYFQVLDYGTGMNNDDIKKYFSLLESDKTNDTNTTGSLGLGAKSPFCYSDQYFIDTVKNGIRRLYFAEDNGIPTLSLKVEEQTDLLNQTMITVPVTSDHHIWAKETKEVLQYFEVKPLVITHDQNRFELDKKELELDLKKSKTKFYKKTNSYIQHDTFLQANVSYPISDEFNELSGYGHFFEVDFDNGQLEFVPSREHISFDVRTTKNIREKLKLIHLELEEEFNKQIEKFTNNYDKNVYIHFKMPKYLEIASQKYIQQQKAITGYNFSSYIPLKPTKSITFRTLKVSQTSTKDRSDLLLPGSYISHYISTTEVYFIMDNPKIIRNRIVHYLRTNFDHSTTGICLSADANDTEDDQNTVISNITHALGNPKIILYSSLPKVKRVKKIKDPNAPIKVKRKNKVLQLNSLSTRMYTQWIDAIDFDINEINKTKVPIYYVLPSAENRHTDYSYIFRELKTLGFIGNVIKLTPRLYEIVKDNSLFVNFLDHAKIVVNNNIEKFNKLEEANLKTSYFSHFISYMSHLNKYIHLIKDPDSFFLKMHKENSTKITRHICMSFNALKSKLGFPVIPFTIEATNEAIKFKEEFDTKYPLFTVLSYSVYTEPNRDLFIKELFSYINAKDAE